MDWRAVAAALVSTSAPSVVLDRQQRIRHCNTGMEELLGRSLDELEGEPFSALTAVGPDAERGAASIATGAGSSVQLLFERTPIEGGFLVVVRETHERAHEDGTLEYEIAPSLTDFGRLVRLRMEGVRRSFWGACRPVCHEILHASERPCSDCPALTRRPGPVARAPRRPSDPYEVLEMVTCPATLRMRVSRVEAATLAYVRVVRLAEALDTAELSERERAVLTLLAERCPPAEIAQRLAVGVRRVHALAVAGIGKLDAPTRAELARLLL